MPNNHVICLVVWRELYSCLSHNFHDNSKLDSKQDQQIGDEKDNASDELDDGSLNIQHSMPFVMETIQQRVKQLVNNPVSSISSKGSQVLINQSKKESGDHTSMEPADNSLHQVSLITPTFFTTV